MRIQYGQVLLVDDGGYFPEAANEHDIAWFMMDAMKLLRTDAVGVGERDLKYGLAWLKSQQKRTGLPITSANLLDKKTGKPVFQPFIIKKVGNVKVGIFGLISDKVDLGQARDSLVAQDPMVATKQAIASIHKAGATVVVLLSQLGKVESEDLVTAVTGVDAVVTGRNVPLIQKGRLIKNTVVGYGGEQGQYMGRTVLTIGAGGKVTTGDNDMFILSPDVGEKPEMLALVKSFEDAYNEKLRKTQMEQDVQKQTAQEDNPDHYLGSELCIRCHSSEGDQWKTTAHSLAWQTLVNVKKDATPECIGCHSVGYTKPGGFVSATATPHLENVQCENCHGIGTQHDAFAATAHRITAEVCQQCHKGENDPEFDFAKKLPRIAHNNFSGETIKNMKNSMPPGMMKTPESGSKNGTKSGTKSGTN
jgi:hypothetical protein